MEPTGVCRGWARGQVESAHIIVTTQKALQYLVVDTTCMPGHLPHGCEPRVNRKLGPWDDFSVSVSYTTEARNEKRDRREDYDSKG